MLNKFLISIGLKVDEMTCGGDYHAWDSPTDYGVICLRCYKQPAEVDWEHELKIVPRFKQGVEDFINYITFGKYSFYRRIYKENKLRKGQEKPF